jgi:beta-aspartyl-peptidase (threonine type)
MPLARVRPEYFRTPRRLKSWEEKRKKLSQEEVEKFGTVGCVALDRDGHLAAGTSTGGTPSKLPGRVGDTPIVGAGTWADDPTCGVSCTGTGEEFIRHGVAQRVSDLMAFRGVSLEEAVDEVVHRVLQPGDGGLIAIDHRGAIVTAHSTAGMLRGAADSNGRYEVAIWQTAESVR